MSSSSSDRYSSVELDSDSSSGETYKRLHQMMLLTENYLELPDDEPIVTHRVYINRDRENAHKRLVEDYFAEPPLYGDGIFRTRFRMRKELFLRIVEDLEREFPYFQLRNDCRGKRGFTALQKCTSAIRQLAYGSVPDAEDEYFKMSSRTSRESLEQFCEGIIILYGSEFLRKPTRRDIELLYAAHESRHGFPGMLGSIDCTHWSWRNCPTRYRGQFHSGRYPYPTIILEAVASQDTWIWHAYFGVAGSNNDINVLNQSPIFNGTIQGTAPRCPFQVNGVQYELGYYLADGIYPSWATFVKSFAFPNEEKRKKFKGAQEAARKDVERAFGILKSKWAIINNPARKMSRTKIANIMYACIILHNMILKDENKAISPIHEMDPPTNQEVNPNVFQQIRSSEIHHTLRMDLVEHIWNIHLPDEE